MRVVTSVRGGVRKAAAARIFGVSRGSIDTWLAKVACGNITSLHSKKRGPPPQPRWPGHPAATIVRLITDRCPDPLQLPFALWTRAAVRDLIAHPLNDMHVRERGGFLEWLADRESTAGRLTSAPVQDEASGHTRSPHVGARVESRSVDRRRDRGSAG